MFKQGFALLLFGLSLVAVAASPANFSQAKDIALTIFKHQSTTLYCGCQFNQNKQVDLNNCQMHQALPIERAHRIEWEHMMPASTFGHRYACWYDDLCENHRNGKKFHGRRCCEKHNPEFRMIESELYNLWPSVGVINQVRSNYAYGEVLNKSGYYGCDFDVDRDHQVAEPADRAKGIVARANLFMAWKYSIKLSAEQRAMLQRWNDAFPPNEWERHWAEYVASVEHYPNPFVHFYQDKKALSAYLKDHQPAV